MHFELEFNNPEKQLCSDAVPSQSSPTQRDLLKNLSADKIESYSCIKINIISSTLKLSITAWYILSRKHETSH